MSEQRKRIMIVDDSDIDREILKNILESDYEVVEESNGYSALEKILSRKTNIDALMLDISMPIVDGFAVLGILQCNEINDLPVIMITSEATRENVFKAVGYGITEFIGKPFDPDVILQRLRGILDIPEKTVAVEEVEENNEMIRPHYENLSNRDIKKTNEYFEHLKSLFSDFIKNRCIDEKHYIRVAKIMRILVEYYSTLNKYLKLTSDHIDIISKSAYLYNIGMMVLPDSCLDESVCAPEDRAVYESHTQAGAKIIRLNKSPSCSYFVNICSDICMHHHERYDGAGFPHGLKAGDNSVFASLCGLISDFDRIFIKRIAFDENQFDFVMSELEFAGAKYNPEVIRLFKECKKLILLLYKRIQID